MVEPLVLRIAGILILMAALLSYFVHPAWIALAALVGIGLVQVSFTGFCPAAAVLRKLRLLPGRAS